MIMSFRGVLDVIVIVIGAGTILALTVTTWYRYRSSRRTSGVPEVWIQVGEVGDLWMYPLTCGKAVEIEEAECTEDGLQLLRNEEYALKDRELLVYREDTGDELRDPKSLPDLASVVVTAEDPSHVRLEAPGIDPLILKMNLKRLVPCEDYGEDAARWVSRCCLGEDRGLRMAKRNRKVNRRGGQGGESPSYSDFRVYLIVNQTSLEDLSDRLPDVVSPLNFRPNIVIDGPEPYSENDWNWLKIGEDVIFRCIDKNVDSEAGGPASRRRKTEKNRPDLHTSSMLFGIQAEIEKPGRIKLGDKVYVATE